LNQQSQPLQHPLNSPSYSGVFPYYYFQHINPYYYFPYNNIHSRKENTKPYSTSDFIEKVFLEPLRQLREFKQLLDDICPLPKQQQRYYYHPAMWPWQNYPYVNGNNNSSSNNWSSIQRIVDPSYLVFGYKARMCNYCSEPKLERVLYKDDSNKATDDEISHNCNLESSKPLNNILRPKENNTDPLEAQKKQALALKELIFNDWLRKLPICLIAAELSNTANKEFAVQNILDPNKKVRINCSQVKEVDVFPTYKNQDHYIIRVIKDNPTYLTDDEIDEFLKVVGDSTFAVVKFHDANDSSVKFYFMALSPFSQRFPRSNYDYDNYNNNNNDGSNDDDIKINLNFTNTRSNLKNEKIAKDQFLSDLDPRMAEIFADMLRNNNKK
jgi:hypothetical protein